MTRGLKKAVRKMGAKMPLKKEDEKIFEKMFPVNFEKALKFFGKKSDDQ